MSPFRLFAAVSLAALAAAVPAAPSSQGDDDRIPIAVGAPGRAMILHEMRTMLQSVQGVTAALGDGDAQKAAAAARASGMAMAMGGGVAPEVRSRLPGEFRQMGHATHMAFDTLAMAAEQGETVEMLAGRLGETLAGCVACHQRFRLTAE